MLSPLLQSLRLLRALEPCPRPARCRVVATAGSRRRRGDVAGRAPVVERLSRAAVSSAGGSRSSLIVGSGSGSPWSSAAVILLRFGATTVEIRRRPARAVFRGSPPRWSRRGSSCLDRVRSESPRRLPLIAAARARLPDARAARLSSSRSIRHAVRACRRPLAPMPALPMVALERHRCGPVSSTERRLTVNQP